MARAEAIFNFLFRFVFYRLPRGCKELHREVLCTLSPAAHNMSSWITVVAFQTQEVASVQSTALTQIFSSVHELVCVCVCAHGILSYKYNPVWASQVALVVKNPPANAGGIRDVGLIPGSGRCPGGGHGNLLQYSCLENPMDSGAWWATVRGVIKSQKWLKRQHAKRCVTIIFLGPHKTPSLCLFIVTPAPSPTAPTPGNQSLTLHP